MNKRLNSLDAFRGLAILCMVLSSSIAFGEMMPAWMFHAQTPPPTHVFNPNLPGITWVDLVFPFFLFSMGAAIPLALHKKAEAEPFHKILLQLFTRLVLLAFFAIFTFHARAWVMEKTPTTITYLISIAAFACLFLIYGNWSSFVKSKFAIALKVMGIVLALAFLGFYAFAYGDFSLAKSDIIIIVLANMAFFGGLIWYFTRNKPIWRIALLPFVMAVFLASKEDGSINNLVFYWSPADWLYKFYYLKYLFIIIPGTFAGEWFIKESKNENTATTSKKVLLLITGIASALVFVNLWGLFTRALELNLLINLIGCACLLLLAKDIKQSELINKMIYAGVYLLLLGLFFEAYEGGIKKDFSTYSYYFVCSGLSFLTLLSFSLIEKMGYLNAITNFLANNGKNPMIAYTAGNLLLIPILKMTTLSKQLDAMNTNAFVGCARGIIFTGVVALITLFFTRIKFFWKT
jgi:predicted acyltransferase